RAALLDDEVLARARREAPIAAVRERSFGTSVETIRAEQAAAEIDAHLAARSGNLDRIGRTGFDAALAPVGTLRRIDLRRAAKTIRHRRRRAVGIAHRPMALSQTREQDLEHVPSLPHRSW